jgi:2-polyprenyl-3-methyl-5-hydroxy-6-metoxy-1,4-benzoquinol methylase
MQEAPLDDVTEHMRLDQTTHSIFGASKVAADVMVQEYGRYFGMNTCVFRGGCLTGPNHSGVALHGFLSYLIKCAVKDIPYKVFGYKGKQVRDNIHSYDVIKAMECVIKRPIPGAVYNIGGCRENSTSMLEAINFLEKYLNKKMNWEYIDENRVGDHICYITDMSKFKLAYPEWRITKSLERIMIEIIGHSQAGLATERYVPGDGEDARFESYSKELVPMCKGRVLDIGCGHGYLTQKIGNLRAVNEVTGTDKLIQNTQTHPKVFYWNINTEELYKTTNMGEFQTIISTEHIEHIGWRLHQPLLDWIKLHLSADGHFIGSMPTPDDPENPNQFHLKTYTLEEWTDILYHNFKQVVCKMVYKDCYCWDAWDPVNVQGIK